MLPVGTFFKKTAIYFAISLIEKQMFGSIPPLRQISGKSM
jgi:hypothetical protein